MFLVYATSSLYGPFPSEVGLPGFFLLVCQDALQTTNSIQTLNRF